MFARMRLQESVFCAYGTTQSVRPAELHIFEGDGHDACTRTGTVGAKRSYALEASTSHRQELIHLFVEVLDGPETY